MDAVWELLVVGGWILNVLVGLLLILLVRQVGLLSRRLPEYGARDDHQGPAIGDTAPTIDAVAVSGEPVTLAEDKRNLLVFLSTTCDACVELVPSIRSLGRQARSLNLVLIANGEVEAVRRFVDTHRLGNHKVVVSSDIGATYGVQYPPYAFAVDERLVVRAKGLVNHAEHLRSLLNAMDGPTPLAMVEPVSHVDSVLPTAQL